MTNKIAKKVGDWQWIQSLAFDLLKSLSDQQLSLTVGKNMGTIGEQFRHMARIRFQYAESIESRKVDDVVEKIDHDVAKSGLKLVELWEKANRKLLEVLESLGSSEESDKITIDWKHWGAGNTNIHDHLNFLMDHETLHNGQLIVYIRSNDLKFPESWKAWGL